MAFFRDVGTVDSKIDLFMMVMIVGRMLSTQDFKTDVGIGSNSHDFGGEAVRIFQTSDSDTDVKLSRG